MRLNAYTITTVSCGNMLVSRFKRASIAPFISKETNNKKPRLTTSEKESRRLKSIFKNPVPLGFDFNFQIWLMESWISLNTLVAPKSKVMMPTTVAK
jgi:hypothetical protein